MSNLPTIDQHLGSPVLPASVRRVRSDERGALTFWVDSEDHDTGLLRSLAEAVRVDDEVPGLLAQFAEVMNQIDRSEREDRTRTPGHRALLDEADDLRGQIEAAMEWQAVGEPHIASLRPADSTVLATALAPLAKPEPTSTEKEAAA